MRTRHKKYGTNWSEGLPSLRTTLRHVSWHFRAWTRLHLIFLARWSGHPDPACPPWTRAGRWLGADQRQNKTPLLAGAGLPVLIGVLMFAVRGRVTPFLLAARALLKFDDRCFLAACAHQILCTETVFLTIARKLKETLTVLFLTPWTLETTAHIIRDPEFTNVIPWRRIKKKNTLMYTVRCSLIRCRYRQSVRYLWIRHLFRNK